MKKIIMIVIIIIIFITVIKFISPNQEEALPFIQPTSTPSPTPKTFQYDSSTDLNKELDNVNPQVLDSDFNE